ncbi:cytochrome P450 [Infundibulicybe gibba]|nr:cytochrome P450 [Infundibulicybe gibba]
MGRSSLYYSSIVLGAVFIVGLFRAYARNMNRNPKRLPLPPGPKGLPIIGNLLSMPTVKPWLAFSKWSKIYGDIMYLNICGKSIVVLDSTRRTTELLERRSSTYSDRPPLPMLADLMKSDFLLAIMPYGARWRRHRRLFREHFHVNAVSKYNPVQSHETKVFLRRLLQSPGNLREHIRHAFAATENDPYIMTAEKAVEGIAEAGVPGAFLVDFIPILKYVPAWMPGAGFKRKAARWRDLGFEMSEKPWGFVKSQHSQGMAPLSVATAFLDGLPPIGDERREGEEICARDTAAIAYADTTVSTVHGFFMAMALYPDVQRKAQAELDSVLGKNRLPEFDDRDSLPYVNAVAKEAMRWQNVTPLAFPHMSMNDDEYDGYFIPKGTLVIGNVWSILHDPEIYDQPLEFKPERFSRMEDRPQRPRCGSSSLGFGRRMCPGRHFSNNSLFCTISTVLSVFSISHALDKHGNPIPIQPEMTAGILSYPVPFRCDIRPRSATAEKLIWDSQEPV